MDFFHDGQIRRYLLQFIRIFSDMKIKNGPDANGLYTIQRVPIVYGDPSVLVAQLIKGASENTMVPSPMFSAWISDIKPAPDRRQDTMYVGKISTVERQFDRMAGNYTSESGIRHDVDRYMPVPYNLTMHLDVWTTNTTTKLQILEQICTIFNPSIQLQQNSNLMDWTSIFEVWLEDITWSNRSVQQTGDEARDILSFIFKVPIWINPPARVKRSTLIAEIVTNVFNTVDIDDARLNSESVYDYFRCIDADPVQIITTEGNHKIEVRRGDGYDEIQLLTAHGASSDTLSWPELIEKYGIIVPDVTKLRLKLDKNIEVDSQDIIGYIEVDTGRADVLKFYPDLDTLPGSTLPPIMDIIDPTEVSPGDGLPAAASGHRYLITSAHSAGEEPAIPPGVVTSPWGIRAVVYPNDIIEFNGAEWQVAFDSRSAKTVTRVLNIGNKTQYTFDGSDWAYTYYGIYSGGYWRIDNITKLNDSD